MAPDRYDRPSPAPAAATDEATLAARDAPRPRDDLAGRGSQGPGGADDGQRTLDRAFDRIEAQVPDQASRAIRRLRDPKGAWVRIPLGLALIAGSFLAILPVFGLWMLPLGLLLIAVDVPFLQRPVGRATLWADNRLRALRRRWRRRGGR